MPEDAALIELIVVDNASTDRSGVMVSREFPHAALVALSANLGFARANNEGLRRSRGRYVMLLNPDTLIQPTALKNLIEFMDANPDVGAVGPRLLNRDGSLQYSCRSYPGIGAGFFRNTPLGRLFPQNRYTRHYLLSGWNHNDVRSVDWLSGACLMVRREVLDQVGLLDEDFYMYCEDIDWCYRMERSGWRKCYFPQAEVIHLLGRSSDQRIPAMIVAHHRSMARFYFKHYFFGWRKLLMPLFIGGIIMRCAAGLLKHYFFTARM